MAKLYKNNSRTLKTNPLPNHERGQVRVCTAIDNSNEVQTSLEATREQEISIIIENLMKSRVFKNLFDTLELENEAQKEANSINF